MNVVPDLSLPIEQISITEHRTKPAEEDQQRRRHCLRADQDLALIYID